LTIKTSDLEHASLLKVQVGSLVGIVRRVICDVDGTVVYVGKAVYGYDIVKFERGFTKPKHKSRASVKYGSGNAQKTALTPTSFTQEKPPVKNIAASGCRPPYDLSALPLW
jgi:hypothetical protein